MAKLTRKRNTLPYCRWRWTAEQRLNHYAKRDPVSGCVIWQGSVDTSGYGQLGFGNRHYRAHRLAWIVKNGPIPAGLQVCHRCDERRCMNTDHLFLGTISANMNDRKRKNRAWYGAMDDVNDAAHGAADLAPIRVLYRGVEFVGKAVARPIDPAMQLPMIAPAARPARARAPRLQTRGSRAGHGAGRSGARS